MKYYLVDYENVAKIGLTGINKLDKNCMVVVFYNELSMIPIDLMIEINSSQAKFDWIILEQAGMNALDLQLTTYIGVLINRIKSNHEDYEITIVSKDNGYNSAISFIAMKFNINVKKTNTIQEAITDKEPKFKAKYNCIELIEQALIENNYDAYTMYSGYLENILINNTTREEMSLKLNNKFGKQNKAIAELLFNLRENVINEFNENQNIVTIDSTITDKSLSEGINNSTESLLPTSNKESLSYLSENLIVDFTITDKSLRESVQAESIEKSSINELNDESEQNNSYKSNEEITISSLEESVDTITTKLESIEPSLEESVNAIITKLEFMELSLRESVINSLEIEIDEIASIPKGKIGSRKPECILELRLKLSKIKEHFKGMCVTNINDDTTENQMESIKEPLDYDDSEYISLEEVIDSLDETLKSSDCDDPEDMSIEETIYEFNKILEVSDIEYVMNHCNDGYDRDYTQEDYTDLSEVDDSYFNDCDDYDYDDEDYVSTANFLSDDEIEELFDDICEDITQDTKSITIDFQQKLSEETTEKLNIELIKALDEVDKTILENKHVYKDSSVKGFLNSLKEKSDIEFITNNKTNFKLLGYTMYKSSSAIIASEVYYDKSILNGYRLYRMHCDILRERKYLEIAKPVSSKTPGDLINILVYTINKISPVLKVIK